MAFVLWRGISRKLEIDDVFAPVLRLKTKEVNWLRYAREGREFSMSEMAARLEISRAAYSQLEGKAGVGKLTLEKMEIIAESMDCEVVFAIRPKSGEAFSVSIWNQILPEALKHPQLRVNHPATHARRLAAAVRRLHRDHAFRKSKGWSRRVEP